MTDDYYLFDEKAHTLKGESTKKAYRLGDKVEVQLVRVDLERRQIDLALVDVLQRAAAGARKGAPPRAGRRERPPAPGRGRVHKGRRS
jgi:ribonuclease R